jgi:hypothetical protein
LQELSVIDPLKMTCPPAPSELVPESGLIGGRGSLQGYARKQRPYEDGYKARLFFHYLSHR